METASKLKLGVLIFEGFELLDAYGPMEMFGMCPDEIDIIVLAEKEGKVKSAQGPFGYANLAISDCQALDILLIPGGIGTRRGLIDDAFISEVKRLAEVAKHVCTVCTGTILLIKTGLLDGLQATTNKKLYRLVTGIRPAVNWVPSARWVEDGKYFTSSGVTAGMDMALAVIEKLLGKEKSVAVATNAEYEWHKDKNWDPFAKTEELV
jgi:putative intracellular protease/amidase